MLIIHDFLEYESLKLRLRAHIQKDRSVHDYKDLSIFMHFINKYHTLPYKSITHYPTNVSHTTLQMYHTLPYKSITHYPTKVSHTTLKSITHYPTKVSYTTLQMYHTQPYKCITHYLTKVSHTTLQKRYLG